VLKLRAPAQRISLIAIQPESHRHADMVSRLIPRRPGCLRDGDPPPAWTSLP